MTDAAATPASAVPTRSAGKVSGKVSGKVASIAIRTDAGMSVGMGHITRMSALAGELRRLGCECAVFTGDAAPERFDGYDALIVDTYLVDGDYGSAARASGTMVVFVDDNASREYDCDVLLNANMHAGELSFRFRGQPPVLLLGARYALLRQEFAREDDPSTNPLGGAPGAMVAPGAASSQRARVFVCFGGSDPHGFTLTAIDAVSRLPWATAVAVLGPETGASLDAAVQAKADVINANSSDARPGGEAAHASDDAPGGDGAPASGDEAHAHSAEPAGGGVCASSGASAGGVSCPRVEIHKAPQGVARLMAGCDIAIAAAGSMSYELAAVGLPGILIVQADNQELAAGWLARNGLFAVAGDWRSVTADALSSAARELLEDMPRRTRESLALRAAVDRRGAANAARAILGAFRSHNLNRL